MEIQITEKDIINAERILLPTDVEFDCQRKIFIKNLSTIDLQAVPGSGKTTALLAKLLILEKSLPFQDGSGILVISHTNTAIDEIKKKISKYCPHLFSYPCFVGTIQSFVDHFLAIPFFSNAFKRNPYRIDDGIYMESVYPPGKAQLWLTNNPFNKDKVLYKSRLNEDGDLVIGFNDPNDFPLKNRECDSYKALLEMKQKLLKRGILCFDDAYYLARRYLRKYPLIKKLLQKRFRYVFVDEMQDMDRHQYDLLEDIFFDNGNSVSLFQRIGDKNQAIFGEVKFDEFWSSAGREVLNINGSCRFSKEIADAVQCFALTRQDIDGRSPHRSVKPHLLIYDNNSIGKVLPKFVNIFKNKQLSGEIPKIAERAVKAIGWRKHVEEPGKITLKDYFPEFNENTQTIKVVYSSLNDYILNSNIALENRGLGDIRKNILNAFLTIFRLEEIRESDRYYLSQNRFIHFMQEKNDEIFTEFKLKMFLWCRDIYRGFVDKVLEEMKHYLPDFIKKVFRKNQISQKTKDFINGTSNNSSESLEIQNVSKNKNNIYKYNGVEVEVGTIHSIKGETHTATLYLETYYNNDGRKGKYISYESQRLKEFFKGNKTNGNEKKHVRESLKMAYVGMSRPTHLLCVAVHKDNIIDYINEIPDILWEKIEV